MLRGLMRRISLARYDNREITVRIEKMREGCRLQQKEVALGIGMKPDLYSHKAAGRTPWKVLDIDRLREFYRTQTGRLLLGWPLLPDEVVEHLEAVYGSRV